MLFKALSTPIAIFFEEFSFRACVYLGRTQTTKQSVLFARNTTFFTLLVRFCFLRMQKWKRRKTVSLKSGTS